MTQGNNLINPAGNEPRDIHPTPGTYNPGLWERKKGEWLTKPRMEINIGGARNTVLDRTNNSVTSQKIDGIRPAYHQAVEESLIHQARETTTRIRPLLITPRLDFWASRTKVISKPSCPNSK